jgi:hypothetical protein
MGHAMRLGFIIVLLLAAMVAAAELLEEAKPMATQLGVHNTVVTNTEARLSALAGETSSKNEEGEAYSAEAHEAAKVGVLEAAQRGDLEAVRRRLAQELRKTCSRKNCGDQVRRVLLSDLLHCMFVLPLLYIFFNVELPTMPLSVASLATSFAQSDGETSLHRAARLGQSGACRVILRAGGAVNGANRYGSTPLHLAARFGHTNTVKLLLAAGANKELLEEDGQTALFAAAKNGHADVVALLAAAGARLDKRNGYGQTAIHAAAREGKVAAVKALVALGADKNKPSNKKDRDTPVMTARDPRTGPNALRHTTYRAKDVQDWSAGAAAAASGVGWSLAKHVNPTLHDAQPAVVQALHTWRNSDERERGGDRWGGDALRRPNVVPLRQ